MQNKLSFVSDLNGKIIDFNKPFVLFKKINNISAFFAFDKEQEHLIVKKETEQNCYQNPQESPYSNENLFLIMRDNKLEFFGDSTQETHENLDTIHRRINLLQNGGCLYEENRLISYGFMSMDDFNKALARSSKFHNTINFYFPHRKDITIRSSVPNFDKFYYLTTLIEIEKIIQSISNRKKHSEENTFNNLIENITSFSSNDVCPAKNFENISFNLLKRLTHQEHPGDNKEETLQILLNQLRQRLISIAINDKKHLEKALYVNFLENNNIPFGSRLMPTEAAKNRHRIYEKLYKNTDITTHGKNSEINTNTIELVKGIDSSFTESFLI